jgi:hypothetical protein
MRSAFRRATISANGSGSWPRIRRHWFTTASYLAQRKSLWASVANMKRSGYFSSSSRHCARIAPHASTIAGPSSASSRLSERLSGCLSFFDKVTTTLGREASTVATCSAVPKPACGQMKVMSA